MDMDEDYAASADDPAAAFEALRAEVAGVRADLRGLSGPVPDYSATLEQIFLRLDAIEAHPAIRATPQAYAAEMRAAVQGVKNVSKEAFDAAIQQMKGAAADIERLAGLVRNRRRQTVWLVSTGALSAVVGVALWLVCSGPVARALPAGLAVPETMAAATMGMDRWHAGQRLLQSVNPNRWQATVDADTLVLANAEAVAACRQKAAQTGKVQRCVITVAPKPVNGP